MPTPSWLPDDVPLNRPSASRMYDYFLGGHHNLPIDRQLADAVIAVYSEFPLLLRANRAFLRRAVAFLSGQGVDQFLDLGSGIPTVGTVHEIARQYVPEARVVYVDIDPIAVSHSQLILQDIPGTGAIQADVRLPDSVFRHAEVERLLDLTRPVAVLLVAFLHFILDDAEATAIVRALRDAVPAGSYLAISHASYDDAPREVMARLEALYTQTPNLVRSRTHARIAAFFAGWDLVPPGVVYTAAWRPEGPDDLFFDQPERALAFAGVGRKP